MPSKANFIDCPCISRELDPTEDVTTYLIFKALLLASETLQASPQVVPKYVLVLVEGQQLTSSGIRSLAEAARPLHALGVTVYVVGIGASLNMKELLAMVHSPEYIITVPRFAELLRKVDSIAQHIGRSLDTFGGADPR